jgi:hypothetical protein
MLFNEVNVGWVALRSTHPTVSIGYSDNENSHGGLTIQTNTFAIGMREISLWKKQ